MQTEVPIICDLGTGYMKMGFAGESLPRRSFPSIIGRPMLRYQETIDDVQLKPIMIGDEVTKYRSLLELSYPTSEGIVRNWDDMSLLLDYSFKSLGVSDMRDKSVFMTEAVMNPTQNRVKMSEVLFEKFGIGRMQLGVQALLSLFAEGLLTALLLDSGDGVTHVIPVFEGYILGNQVARMNLAGRHITNHLVKLMHMRGYAFNSTADFEMIRELKEKYCFISGDFKLDDKLSQQTTHHEKVHTLPDGQKIKLGRERFLAPEILFKPELGGFQFEGCGDMVFNSINKCDISLRPKFYDNILISGGTTMIPGFPTRLLNEIQSLHRQKIMRNSVSKTIKFNVIDPPSRKYHVFNGASLTASATMSTNDGWVTKQQYKEKGATRLMAEMPAPIR